MSIFELVRASLTASSAAYSQRLQDGGEVSNDVTITIRVKVADFDYLASCFGCE